MGWRRALDLILPRSCAVCAQAADGPLCPACRQALPWIQLHRRCALCQDELATLAPESNPHRCGSCLADASPVARCTAAVWLEGDVHAWIRRFKNPARGLAGLDPVAGAVVRELARESVRRGAIAPPDCVIPIPLHANRLRARGFNPAGLLATAVAHEAGVGVRGAGLVRVRDTPRQTGRGRYERRENMADAFAWRSRRPPPDCIWLIDDVVTTGATLSSAARTLRQAGVREIVAVCAARTRGPQSR